MQILIGIIFILTLVAVYFLTDDWFSPARIHTAIWTFFYFGYIIFSNSVNLKYRGVFWLIISCYVITIGEQIGKKLISIKKQKSGETNLETSDTLTAGNRFRPFHKYLWYVIILFFILGLIGNYIEIRMYGYNLSVFFNFSKLLDMNNTIAVDRYSGAGKSSQIATLMTAFRYGGALCGGYSLVFANRWYKKVICFLPMVASLINMATNNTKIPMISSVILFVISFMVAFLAFYGRAPKIKLKQILIVVAMGVGLLVLLIISMMLRTGAFDRETFAQIKEKFIVYAFGNVEAFDYWFSNIFKFGNYGWGVNTFMAPFALLGLVEKKTGVYDFYSDISSNVFTGYRGVITDWGMIGGMIFVLLLGILGIIALTKIKLKGITTPYIVIFSAVLFFIIYSFVISPWVYTTYWAAFVIFGVFLVLADGRLFGVDLYEKKHNRKKVRD